MKTVTFIKAYRGWATEERYFTPGEDYRASDEHAAYLIERGCARLKPKPRAKRKPATKP